MKTVVLGAGAWGTALACHAARAPDARVVLWTRSPEHAAALTHERVNARYLPGLALPAGLICTADWGSALADAQLVVVATSVAGLRDIVQRLVATVPKPVSLVGLCKGLDADSAQLPSEVVAQIAPQWSYGVLSGPSFAQEVAVGLPVALTVAACAPAIAKGVVAGLHHGAARIYHTDDVRGVEVAGALKNIFAVAAGVADGLGLGLNARAALLTRGLAEMQRYGLALGARPETFLGLAGVGDLLLTCTGDLSRNRRVGLRVAQGESLAAILADLGHVAEGVACCQAVRARAQQLGVGLPIVDAVAQVLFEQCAPQAAVAALLARDPTVEFLDDRVRRDP